MVDISFASEDILSEVTLCKIINSFNRFNVIHKLGRTGCGDIIKNIEKFNSMSKRHHVIVMLDLDMKKNEQELIDYLHKKIKRKEEKLLFLIPVKEIESWFLADRKGLSSFLEISENKININPDELLDPKEKIITLAKDGKNPTTRTGIPPKKGAAAKVGISYNTLLKKYVTEFWSIERAKECSPSLNKTLLILKDLQQI